MPTGWSTARSAARSTCAVCWPTPPRPVPRWVSVGFWVDVAAPAPARPPAPQLVRPCRCSCPGRGHWCVRGMALVKGQLLLTPPEQPTCRRRRRWSAHSALVMSQMSR